MTEHVLGGFWTMHVPAQHAVGYVPEHRVTLTRACIALELPEGEDPVRGSLKFGYSGANDEEYEATIAIFINSLAENHNFVSFHLEPNKSYTFECDYYNIDLIGYYSERIEAPPAATKTKARASSAVPATKAPANRGDSSSGTQTRKSTPSNASKPADKKHKRNSAPPAASTRVTRRRSRSLQTVSEKGEEAASQADGSENDDDDDDDDDGGGEGDEEGVVAEGEAEVEVEVEEPRRRRKKSVVEEPQARKKKSIVLGTVNKGKARAK
ncbi:hypothetical protein EST38_g13030 [Candolleomyces aberdarensis]|uniref:Nucleoplasmin-like domain-containing protein n=1 Tax=Candolleomyces aberdarensis TaxID=2316362 RepID=A0A4Q2D0Y9_9AGAR|nr:hypothetical protein EST38_g13030 [Candolleomyces aberdarensis]